MSFCFGHTKDDPKGGNGSRRRRFFGKSSRRSVLTKQVPIREVYLTSGRTRKLKLGRSEVLVKHVPRCMLALGAGPTGPRSDMDGTRTC
jgi:hypothetical protein